MNIRWILVLLLAWWLGWRMHASHMHYRVKRLRQQVRGLR